MFKKIKNILRRLHPLLSISIEPTNDCNWDCWYCHRKERPIGYMLVEKYQDLLHQLPVTCRVIALSYGGESAMHPQLNLFVDYTHKRGYTPIIYSNGSMKYPPGVKLMIYPKPPKEIITSDEKFLEDYHLTPVNKVCPEIWTTTNVLWNGDIVPCCHDVGGYKVIGNAFEDGLMKVWNSKKYDILRKKGYCEGCEVFKHELTYTNRDDYVVK